MQTRDELFTFRLRASQRWYEVYLQEADAGRLPDFALVKDRTTKQVVGRRSECEADRIEGHTLWRKRTFCREGRKLRSNCAERSLENELKPVGY